MSSPTTAEITPRPDAEECDATDCTADELLAEVDPQGRPPARVLCPDHRVGFLREVSDE